MENRINSKAISAIILALCLSQPGCLSNTAPPAKPRSEQEISSLWKVAFDSAFSSDISVIQALPDGRFWTVRNQKTGPDARSTTLLELRTGRGELLESLPYEGEVVVPALAVHPSEEFSTLELIPKPNGISFSLELKRHSRNGRVLKATRYDEMMPAYLGDEDCSELRKDFFWSRSASIASDGENLVLLAYRCRQHFLHVLDSELKPLWSLPVTPVLHASYSELYGSDRVTVLGDGSLLVVIELAQIDIAEVSRNLHTPLTSIGDKDLLALRVDSKTGERRSTLLIGTPYPDRLSELVPGKKSAWIIGESVFHLSGVPGESRQSDLLISKLDLEQDRPTWIRNLNLSQNDWPDSATVAEDRLIIGGRCGAHQVDSGSVIDFPKGFLLQLNLASGETEKVSYIQGERASGISALSWSKSNSLLLTGSIEDGPITHSGDQDRGGLHSKSYLRAIQLPQ